MNCRPLKLVIVLSRYVGWRQSYQIKLSLRQNRSLWPINDAKNNLVRKAYQYMTNRESNLDYKNTLQNELPIGSGMIESGHKHVLQKRLKITGASWLIENAQGIAHFRVLRANGEWKQYWENRELSKAA